MGFQPLGMVTQRKGAGKADIRFSGEELALRLKSALDFAFRSVSFPELFGPGSRSVRRR